MNLEGYMNPKEYKEYLIKTYGHLKMALKTEFASRDEYSGGMIGMKTQCPYCNGWTVWGTCGAIPTTLHCSSKGCKKEFLYMSLKNL